MLHRMWSHTTFVTGICYSFYLNRHLICSICRNKMIHGPFLLVGFPVIRVHKRADL